jgi:hypothetical protein
MADPLFALSIQQPWIWAILRAGKRVENRTWAPPARIRGQRIALHASKGLDASGFAALSEIIGGGVPSASHLLTGGIVATARLVGAVRIAPIEDPDGPRNVAVELVGHLDEFHPGMVCGSPWSFGPWCWVLEDVLPLPSAIPGGGKLGVWPVEEPFLEAVREQEALARGAPAEPHVQVACQVLVDLPSSIRILLPSPAGRLVVVPKSQILGEAPGSITVTRWFAQREQLTPSP